MTIEIVGINVAPIKCMENGTAGKVPNSDVGASNNAASLEGSNEVLAHRTSKFWDSLRPCPFTSGDVVDLSTPDSTSTIIIPSWLEHSMGSPRGEKATDLSLGLADWVWITW